LAYKDSSRSPIAVGTGQSWKSGDDKIGCGGGFGEKLGKMLGNPKRKNLEGGKKETKPPVSITVRIGYGGLRVERGGSGAQAPPLAARPVPRNGRGPGRRLMELTNGC